MLKTEAHRALDKGKVVASPSSPSSDSAKSVSSCMHLRDDFSYVISEIGPKGSTQPKANSEKSKGRQQQQRENFITKWQIWFLSVFIY
jgi:hypothetical protein